MFVWGEFPLSLHFTTVFSIYVFNWKRYCFCKIIPNLHVNGLFNANCKVYPHENQPTYTVMKKLNSKLIFCNQRTVLKFCSLHNIYINNNLFSYGSWIYNYLCNQCLTPLMLWIRTLFMRESLSVTCDRLVVFFRYSGFLHQ